MAALEELVVRIKADASQLQAEMKRAQSVVQGSSSGMTRSFSGIGKAMRGMGADVGSLGALITPIVGALGVRQLAAYSDAWKGIENRLKLVTSGTDDLAHVSDRLFRIAHDTRSDLTATATLYQRLTFATRGLGISQQEVFKFTEQLNKQLLVGGLSSEEASASIYQLTQALNKGKLDGDEFRTILESMPPLLEALERSLGKSRGEIIAMAAAGKLGPQVLVQAVNSMADVTNKRFADLSLTIGQAFTQLDNAFTRFVGQSEEVGGASAAVANALQFLSENIDEVGRAGLALVAIVGTRLAVGFGVALAAMNPYAAALVAIIGPLTYLATGHTEAEKAQSEHTKSMWRAKEVADKMQEANEKLVAATGKNRDKLVELTKATKADTAAELENIKAKIASEEIRLKFLNDASAASARRAGDGSQLTITRGIELGNSATIDESSTASLQRLGDLYKIQRELEASLAGKRPDDDTATSTTGGGNAPANDKASKIDRAKQALEDYNKQLQRQHEYAQMSPADAAAQKVYYDTLDIARQAGIVNAEAVAQANAEVARSNDLMNKKMEESARFSAELKDQFAETAKSILRDSGSAGEAIRRLGDALADMITQRYILGPLTDTLFGSPGSGGSGGGSDSMAGGLMGAAAKYIGSWIGGSFATGTDYVPRDMLAQIHKGEMIIPAQQAQQIRSGGGSGSGITIVQNNTFQSGVTRAELQQVLPQVAAAAKNAVFDDIKRGGSASKLVGVR